MWPEPPMEGGSAQAANLHHLQNARRRQQIEDRLNDRANLVGFFHQLLSFRLKLLLGQKSVFSQVIQLLQIFVEDIGFG